MKAIQLLKEFEDIIKSSGEDGKVTFYFNLAIHNRFLVAIEELDAYITNYQGINRRLDNTVTALAVLEHQNKSLVKTLEKYNKEMIELRKENQHLKRITNEI